MRAAYRGHSPGSSIRTRTCSAAGSPSSRSRTRGTRTRVPRTAARSRATPRIDSRSPRFGSDLQLEHRVPHAGDIPQRAARGGAGQLEHATRLLSQVEVGLRAQDALRGDAADHRRPPPRDRPAASRRPARRRHGDPGRSPGAAETTVRCSPPRSSRQTARRSASGCGSTASRRATRMRASRSPTSSTASTLRPAIVMRSTSAAVASVQDTNSASQLSGMRTSDGPSELRQEAEVVVVEQAQVVQLVAQQRQRGRSPCRRRSRAPAPGRSRRRAGRSDAPSRSPGSRASRCPCRSGSPRAAHRPDT